MHGSLGGSHISAPSGELRALASLWGTKQRNLRVTHAADTGGFFVKESQAPCMSCVACRGPQPLFSFVESESELYRLDLNRLGSPISPWSCDRSFCHSFFSGWDYWFVSSGLTSYPFLALNPQSSPDSLMMFRGSCCLEVLSKGCFLHPLKNSKAERSQAQQVAMVLTKNTKSEVGKTHSEACQRERERDRQTDRQTDRLPTK